jgi:hypothetical protein
MSGNYMSYITGCFLDIKIETVISLHTLRVFLKTFSYSNLNFCEHFLMFLQYNLILQKKESYLWLPYLYSVIRCARNVLHIHGHETQVCMKKEKHKSS